MKSPVSVRRRATRNYVHALILSLAAPFVAHTVQAGDKALIDTTKSPAAKMYMVDLADTRWTDGFWAERFEACRTTMIPHMWEIFQSEKDSHAWANFLIAAGDYKGDDPHHHGPPFNDGDFLKWVEAVAQMYAVTKDPALDQLLDKIIDVVGRAQREDGY